MTLTQRQRRELEFYEEFSELNAPMEVRFDPILGQETRPWNSYWRVIEIVKQNFVSADQRLLDFGCGKGEYSILFSKVGYQVSGFDLSPNNISIAKRLAAQYDLTAKTHFSVGVAEKLDYPAEHFDIIFGIDILHHVDISQALAECSRVLKSGGLAIFHEPVRVPVFDTLRETKLGRWLVPKEASLDRHVTEDERKLGADDLRIIRSVDPSFSMERFLLFSRLDRFIRNPANKGPSLLEKIDAKLFKFLPFIKGFGGVMIIVLKKKTADRPASPNSPQSPQ